VTEGYRSKINISRNGTRTGGVLLKKASVRRLLMNPVYAGYLLSSGNLSRGSHQAIINVQTWERVSEIRADQIAERTKLAPKELLTGLIYDCFGRSMTANRQLRRGKLHAHYRSNQTAWGIRHRVKRLRISAAQADRLAVSAVQRFLDDRARLRALLTDLGLRASEVRSACHKASVASRRLEAISLDQLRSVFRGLLDRVEVSRDGMKLVTRRLEFEQLLEWDFIGLFRRRTEDTERGATLILDIPCAEAIRLERLLRLPIAPVDGDGRHINNNLRKLISDARSAWAAVEANRGLPLKELASTCNMSISRFMRVLRVNYLAPDILTAIMDGSQPRELTRRMLIDANLPLDWQLQRKLFGFEEQPPLRTVENY
jgi:hypothetical protein